MNVSLTVNGVKYVSPAAPETPLLYVLRNDLGLNSAKFGFGMAMCGCCISGMIMSAYGLLKRNPKSDENEIRAAMTGNLCRCGKHTRIIRAIQRAAKEML